MTFKILGQLVGEVTDEPEAIADATEVSELERCGESAGREMEERDDLVCELGVRSALVEGPGAEPAARS